jgi:hypothetical protein
MWEAIFIGIVMFMLGYLASNIRLTAQRIQVLALVKEAKDVLGMAKVLDQLEKRKPSDRSKGDGIDHPFGP